MYPFTLFKLRIFSGEKIDTKKFDMKEKRIEKRKIKEIKKEQAKRKKVATQGLGRYNFVESNTQGAKVL